MIDNREDILKGLANIGYLGAKAEANPNLLLSTLLIRNHLNFLEPDILLILGGRGAGKTHLFRLINSSEGQKVLRADQRRLANALWIQGFHTHNISHANAIDFPTETNLQRFAVEHNITNLLDFWRGLLLGAILKQVDQTPFKDFLAQRLPISLQESLTKLDHISTWFPEVVKHVEVVNSTLNELDHELLSQNGYIFATYDNLDVMAVESNEKRSLIQALLRFWLSQWGRWRRIRPKIFLRFDLFAPEFLQFPDASKLNGNKIELRWTSHQLYDLVFKAWANQNEASINFLRQIDIKPLKNTIFNWIKDDKLGWICENSSEDNLKATIHAIMGQFMGQGAAKGRTFDWIPKHLQDANGEAVPRSMLNLFALAAQDELDHSRAKDDFLLSHQSIRTAIEEVSQQRITELTEEYSWLEQLRPPLAEKEVPMLREEFEKLLETIDWQSIETIKRPPKQKSSDIVDNLLKIGILRLTSDKRIHVPDIYLYGFKMKRRGGISRPK